MAGRIPQSFIDDLLGRIDIVEVIDEYVPLKKAGRNYQARCPFHNEKTPSFSVSPEKQFFYCFGCGVSGSAIGFLMDYARLEFPEAVRELAARAGLRLPEEAGPSSQTPSLEPLLEILEKAARFYKTQLREHPEASKAVDYLKRRGVSGLMAREFGLGYAPPGWNNLSRALGGTKESDRVLDQAGLLVNKDDKGYYDRFRDRIMFPILDRRGRVIGFGGRVLGDEEPKYLNSPETPLFHKGSELYGLYHALRAGKPARLLIVEGYMDVLTLAQYGFHHAVATLGTATTGEHLERLFRAVSEVIFCFDGDAAGQRAAWRALEVSLPHLKEGRTVGFLFMPEGEDPDSLVRKEGVARFQDSRQVVSLSDFLFNNLLRQVNMATLDGRARLVESAKPLISAVPPGPLRDLMWKRLSELSGLETHQLAPAYVEPHVRASIRPADTTQRHPSLVRMAVALLLREPSLASLVESPSELSSLSMPGIPLLVSLIELIKEKPGITCGALLERWRDTEEGRHLGKLASWDLPVPPQGREAEFVGAVQQLRKKLTKQQRLSRLLDNIPGPKAGGSERK
jgi:DNA primase